MSLGVPSPSLSLPRWGNTSSRMLNTALPAVPSSLTQLSQRARPMGPASIQYSNSSGRAGGWKRTATADKGIRQGLMSRSRVYAWPLGIRNEDTVEHTNTRGEDEASMSKGAQG